METKGRKVLGRAGIFLAIGLRDSRGSVVLDRSGG